MNSTTEQVIEKIFCQLDITDISLIRIILNQDYLLGIIKAFDNAIHFHAQNKDFFYTFKALPIKEEKIYNAHQLLNLRRAYEEKRVSKDLMYYYSIENERQQIIRLDIIDQILLIFYIAKYNYLKIYDAIQRARSYRKDVKTFEFNYKPSVELYGDIESKIYTDKYLLLLYETSYHPLFIKKFNELLRLQIPHILKNK